MVPRLDSRGPREHREVLVVSLYDRREARRGEHRSLVGPVGLRSVRSTREVATVGDNHSARVVNDESCCHAREELHMPRGVLQRVAPQRAADRRASATGNIGLDRYLDEHVSRSFQSLVNQLRRRK